MFEVLAALHPPILCMKIENLTLSRLFSQLSNWFMFYCFSRTLSNSLETSYTSFSILLALHETFQQLFLCFKEVGFGCGSSGLCYPTNKCNHMAPIGILVLGLTCLLDCFMYGTWILVPLKFLKFNFLSAGGDYYGTHKWHWYFTQGFPVMIFSHLPFILYSWYHLFQTMEVSWPSCMGFAFLQFIRPQGIQIPVMHSIKEKKSSKKHTRVPPKMGAAILFLLATNIPMALYEFGSSERTRGCHEPPC